MFSHASVYITVDGLTANVSLTISKCRNDAIFYYYIRSTIIKLKMFYSKYDITWIAY